MAFRAIKKAKRPQLMEIPGPTPSQSLRISPLKEERCIREHLQKEGDEIYIRHAMDLPRTRKIS